MRRTGLKTPQLGLVAAVLWHVRVAVAGAIALVAGLAAAQAG